MAPPVLSVCVVNMGSVLAQCVHVTKDGQVCINACTDTLHGISMVTPPVYRCPVIYGGISLVMPPVLNVCVENMESVLARCVHVTRDGKVCGYRYPLWWPCLTVCGRKGTNAS